MSTDNFENQINIVNKLRKQVISQFSEIKIDMDYMLCIPSIHAKFQDEENALHLAFTGTIKEDILQRTEIAYYLVKFLIEQDRPIVVEYILKLVYANIALVVLYFIAKQFVYVPAKWYLVLLFEVVFLIYDYVYSLFIDYYNKKLKNIFEK